MQMVQILEFVFQQHSWSLLAISFHFSFVALCELDHPHLLFWVHNFVHNSCFGSRCLDGSTKHEWCNLSSEFNPDSWFCDFQWGFFWICTDWFSSAIVHDGSSFDSSLWNISAKEWCNLRVTSFQKGMFGCLLLGFAYIVLSTIVCGSFVFSSRLWNHILQSENWDQPLYPKGIFNCLCIDCQDCHWRPSCVQRVGLIN